MIRAPVMPNGWPRAMAPPWTFSLSIGMPSSLADGMTWAAKASLISTRSMSAIVLPARAMGLAEALPWIPKIPIPSGSGRRKKKAARKSRGSGQGEVVNGPWATPARSAPPRGAPLPQPPRANDDPHDQAELDQLLDKISARGMDGLTADEKRRLNELSKRLRNRT